MNISAVARVSINEEAALANIVARIGERTLAAANFVYNVSQITVPVDTGELKESGSVSLEDTGEGIAWVGIVRYSASHSEHVEFGTGERGAQSLWAGVGPYKADWKGMPAKGFLRSSLYGSENDILEIYKAA